MSDYHLYVFERVLHEFTMLAHDRFLLRSDLGWRPWRSWSPHAPQLEINDVTYVVEIEF